jgi:ammonium transporter, Amt family
MADDFQSESAGVQATFWLALLGSLLLALPALAQTAEAPPPVIDSGDTAWMLTSTALVLMMTAPGLALFYGGLVRRQNILSVLMHCLFCMAMLSVVWVVIGYTLAFGPDESGLIGGLAHLGLAGVTAEPNTGSTIPALLFMMYQGTFAIITPALIVGAIAERMRFSAFVLFTLLWSVLIYSPLCHWVWGGGWLMQRGALDFAGGTVVHISSGVSALVAALLLGKRLGYGREPMPPHNLPFTVAGAALLWVGWFGFNAGSALAANGLAATALVTTNTAAAAAALSWALIEWLTRGKPTALGCASGVVAGLVAITPAAGFVTPMGALAIGLGAGILCFYGIRLKEALGADDSLDVVGVHGVGGTFGAIATGFLATKAVNSLGNDGLFYGNPGQVWVQLEGVLATVAFCGIGSFILLKVVDALVGLRVDEEDEISGLDLSQHSERGYALGGE